MNAFIQFMQAILFLVVFLVLLKAFVVWLQYRKEILAARELIRNKKLEEKQNEIKKEISDKPLSDLVSSSSAIAEEVNLRRNIE